MHKALSCFPPYCQEQLIQTAFFVFHLLETLSELTDDQRPKAGILLSICHIRVDHAQRMTGLLLSGPQIFCHTDVDALLTCENDIKVFFALLKSFLARLYSLIFFFSKICKMSLLVFAENFLVHLLICGRKNIKPQGNCMPLLGA